MVAHRPQGFEHDEHPDPVVHRLAHVTIADFFERPVHRRVVSDPDFFF